MCYLRKDRTDVEWLSLALRTFVSYDNDSAMHSNVACACCHRSTNSSFAFDQSSTEIATQLQDNLPRHHWYSTLSLLL